jgi:hypothetical protein
MNFAAGTSFLTTSTTFLHSSSVSTLEKDLALIRSQSEFSGDSLYTLVVGLLFVSQALYDHILPTSVELAFLSGQVDVLGFLI